MSACPSEDVLLELASGRLEESRAATLHEHIDSCTSCLHAVAELLRSEGAEPSLYPARYRMIEESARGGQARVLRGYDSLTRREVAIKEFLPQVDPSDKSLRRFVHEARLTASLTHPGIVPVFDIGFREDGHPFYTMQFVRGRTLAQVLRSCGSLAERLRYLSHFLELCQAVSFAHSRGIVHRDIKPHNVVVGEFGQTILIDWGLAKLTRAPAEAPLDDADVAQAPDATMSGSILGTPAYMSPEQAAGRIEDVDERSDVFGLGAVLYEILTGNAPHAGSKVTELLDAARTGHAAPIGPDAPRELAVIAEKALAMERADRYVRAADLAADVNAYLTGERVGAYEYSSWELLRRLVTRHKRTTAAAVLGVAALVGVIGALALAVRREDQQRRRAELSGAETMIEGAQTAMALRDVLTARARLRTALETTDSLDARSLWRQLSVDPLLWQVRIGSQPHGMVLSPTERRFGVIGYLMGIRLIDIDTGLVDVLPSDQLHSIQFSAGGRAITSIDLAGEAKRWDLGSRRPTYLGTVGDAARAMAQSPDERALYVVTDGGRLVHLDTATHAVTEIPLSQPVGTGLAIRPDGKELAVVMESGELRTVEVTSGKETARICPRREGMIPAYSPDGKLLGVASEGDKICLFEGGAATPRIVDGEVRGSTVAFSPDGKRFAVGGVDGRLRVWETATGKLLTSLREGDTARARMATWTHDGRAVAVAYNEGGTIRLFSTEMPPPEPGSGQISPGTRPSVAVSPDGETIVTGGEDGRLRFHDRRTGTEVLSLKAHQGAVLSVAYAPDGTVATGGSDGQVRIWDPLGRPLKTMSTPTPFVMSVAFADGGRLVSAADGIQVWDLETGILQRALAVEGANDYPAVSGDEMALGHADGFVSRWSLATGREIERVSLTKDSVDRVAYTHGGRGLAAVTTNGNVLVRDGAGPARNLGSVNCGAEGCLLAAQGERLAVIQLHHRISAWNLATGRRIDFYGEAFQGITLSPDGKTIAGLSPHGILHVWEAETGRPLWRGPILRHTSGEVYTQEGWKSLLGKPAGGSEAWRRAVEADALLTAENGDVLCIYTLDGAVEIWSESRDLRLARVPVPGVGSVESSDRGCVVLTSIPGAASLVDREGKLEELASKATAISARGNTIQVGLEDRVLTLDGATASTEVVDPGVIALARTSEGDLVLGYDHGAIEVRRAGAVLAMKDTPTTQVLRVVASPNLLAAAYTDGTIGLWSTKNGQLLQRWWLHGQARGMTLADSRLLVVTEVGQVGAWNVETFSLPYCQLLQEVWRAVPVVWESGRPVLKSPPAGHPCSGNH